MTESQTIPEKSISDELSKVLSKLTHDQLRFVVAMQECNSKKEAAELLDMKPDTVYRWPDIVDKAVRLFAEDIAESAKQIRRKNLTKAMMVKVAGLDNDDDVLRQRVATEIIEAELGKPTQKQEVKTEHSGEVTIELKWPDADNTTEPA